MQRLIVVLAILGLAGCAGGVLPLNQTVMVPSDQYAGVIGEARTVVRTFTFADDGQRLEVGGATCDVTSILFAARLVTPAPLIVPNFGPQSPTLEFDCRAGELHGTAQQAIVTRWISDPSPWGYGPWGWGPGWGWGGPWGGGSYPIFDYPNVNVILE
jgi:hypothetical protein